ncbi:ras-related protein Rab-27A-like isoform X2 [Petromyzon marinus]|uniref:Ras-related protein Rab-27A-like isoform X1 n=1 Tax=Petromyzon marinus TaxID=7757 RepID=A0AAJ7U4X8_PETMA|nr:ras-related protein Rab-27A-like isoform X1 [Petromyzon marinus]XP_032829794.1 ras-related protein Rab-27A-like isoform X1 [Petromyzon marinus]XP_032829795.1 ras-related protein Rab-27A-like isoform X1 [Petromyzon marinus]
MGDSSGEYDYLIKMLSLGDSGVGKTSVLGCYVDGKFSTKFISTVGIDFREKRVIFNPGGKEGPAGDGLKIHLQLWDTAGQERFRSLTNAFFRDAMGFFVFFDITDEQSFVNVRHWMAAAPRVLPQPGRGAVRKQGRPDGAACRRRGRRAVARERVRKLDPLLHRDTESNRRPQCADHRTTAALWMPYVETSAATGENVARAVELLLERVMRRVQLGHEHAWIPDWAVGAAPPKPRRSLSHDGGEGAGSSSCGC